MIKKCEEVPLRDSVRHLPLTFPKTFFIRLSTVLVSYGCLTNYDKLSGLKPHKFIILKFC